MTVFHFAFLLITVGLIVTASHFIRMSNDIRANDAEGTGRGPAFVAFLKALGCGAAAAVIAAWLLYVAGWYAIGGGAVASLCCFVGLLWFHSDKTVPSWARAAVVISVMFFVVSFIAAAFRAGA